MNSRMTPVVVGFNRAGADSTRSIGRRPRRRQAAQALLFPGASPRIQVRNLPSFGQQHWVNPIWREF